MRPRTVALAIAAGAGSAVTFALVRMKRPRPAGPRSAAPPDTYRCDCGQRFRISGTGRHRVHWLADAAEDDPVLSPHCPACDRPLPRDPSAAEPGGAGLNRRRSTL